MALGDKHEDWADEKAAAAHVESLAPKFIGYQCTCQACGAQFIHHERVGYCPEHAVVFKSRVKE